MSPLLERIIHKYYLTPQFTQELAEAKVIKLNYRWELKDETERGYVEIRYGEHRIRGLPTDVFKEPSSAKLILDVTAKAVRKHVKDRTKKTHLKIKKYYLKGEINEVEF
jgi:hypothetical protein